MNQQAVNQFQREAELFKALSHPVRLFILNKIKDDENLSVSELAAMVGLDISTISKHLDLMRRYKVVVGHKTKNTVYYKVNMPCLLAFMSCATKISQNPLGCNASQCIRIEP